MNKGKIIFILGHSQAQWSLKITNPEQIQKKTPMEYISIPEPPFWIGFFKGDFHVKHANWLRDYTSDWAIECWRPYAGINKIYNLKINSINHKVFPVKKLKLGGFLNLEFSNIMAQTINTMISNKEKFLLFLVGGHQFFLDYLIMKTKMQNIPVFYKHAGGYFPFFLNRSILRPKNIFFHHFQKFAWKSKIDIYLSNVIKNIEYYKKYGNTIKLQMGLDVTKCKSVSKIQSRKKLSLPNDKFILIYIGKYNDIKGLDNIINIIYKGIIKKHRNFYFVFLGGTKSDPLYSKLLDLKNRYTDNIALMERVPEEELYEYLTASNVLLMPSSNKNLINFGGFGFAPMQALICGVPIISSNINEFNGPEIEQKNIGVFANSEDSLIAGINYIYKNYNQFDNVSAIAKKYFSKAQYITKLNNLFTEYFKKYYS